MSERDQTDDHEAEAVIKAIDATLVFCAAWTLWKSTHDVDSLEINCCDASKDFHSTANTLEDSVKKLIMNRNFIKRVLGTELSRQSLRGRQKEILEEQEHEALQVGKETLTERTEYGST